MDLVLVLKSAQSLPVCGLTIPYSKGIEGTHLSLSFPSKGTNLVALARKDLEAVEQVMENDHVMTQGMLQTEHGKKTGENAQGRQ